MNILILGSGAREHAFAWKISRSNKLNKLYVAPGNAGTALIAKNLDIDITEFTAIKNQIIDLNISLVLVGPEIPLINGIVNFLKNDPSLEHLKVIGPTQKGAQLEGSKDFSKEFMFRNNIPTAPYRTFDKTSLSEGLDYLSNINPPYVLKADGPAAGKGVLILENLDKAKEELTNMIINDKFGSSGSRVVIEGFLQGIEMSCFVLVDNKNYIILPSAKDYKRIGAGDTGLNTGGMGSISPVAFADKEFNRKIENRIIKPTVNGIIKEKLNYVGFLFIGIIKVGNEPYVIEYNVRMGDPETQVVLPRIKNDFLDLLISTVNCSLDSVVMEIDKKSYVNVVLASGGYPEKYEKGKIVSGLNDFKDTIIFHAGTKNVDDKIKTSGGRVLSVVSSSSEFRSALQKSYAVAENIKFKDKYFRPDIGFDL
tara:strand:- start:1734 stop:3005 length:1272 start_codon:yes stop_codon:yes gene_type:complete